MSTNKTVDFSLHSVLSTNKRTDNFLAEIKWEEKRIQIKFWYNIKVKKKKPNIMKNLS